MLLYFKTPNNFFSKMKLIEKSIKIYSNQKLYKQTEYIQTKIKFNQSNLITALPFILAIIKEAINRALSINIFQSQIIAGLILYNGKIAEMKTGEGKTIAILIASYLNILENNYSHIITSNEYLSIRDSQLAAKVFKYLNVRVNVITENLLLQKKLYQYTANIVYLTNYQLGFDYLNNNLSLHFKNIFQQKFQSVIIDEIDLILIDQNRNPLILATTVYQSHFIYSKINQLVAYLNSKAHYTLKSKNKIILLKESGIKISEKFLKTKYLFKSFWIKYLLNALKAKEFLKKNQDYIIKNQKIYIIDKYLGRTVKNRQWKDGLHQAIEAKECIFNQNKNIVISSILYEQLFKKYYKISGITGTAKIDLIQTEYLNNLEVIAVPLYNKFKRLDFSSICFKNQIVKWNIVVNEAIFMYRIGRPTLIVTTKIELSEFIYELFINLKIPCQLLNAQYKNIRNEVQIVEQAGLEFSLTIATNVIGRGTDIIIKQKCNQSIKPILYNYIIDNLFNKNSTSYKSLHLQTCLKLNTYFKNKKCRIKMLKKISILSKQEKINYSRDTAQLESICQADLTRKKKIANTHIISKGGLYIIATNKNESKRIDHQLKGRTGRQGLFGSFRFLLSLEDQFLKQRTHLSIFNFLKQLNKSNNNRLFKNIIIQYFTEIQQNVELNIFNHNRIITKYESVISKQKTLIEQERFKILNANFVRDYILSCIIVTVQNILQLIESNYNQTNMLILTKFCKLFQINIVSYYNILLNKNSKEKKKKLENLLIYQAYMEYNYIEYSVEQLNNGLIRKLEQFILLKEFDNIWSQHFSFMESLQSSFINQNYKKQTITIEYQYEALNLFINTVIRIRQRITYLALHSYIK
uniref:Protein translocase subunit SecA n=1 Tax=Pterocladiophila hemisphaerica TaxID=2712948 RepID=A0A6M3WWE9_9FLOR|nr:SecA [Pterocladiophila hemisphaerica]